MRKCKKCGIEFDTHRCEPCHRAGSRLYRQNNLDKVRQQNREFLSRPDIKERYSEKRAEYREKNREVLRIKKAEYARKNSAKIVNKVAEWRKKNPDAKRIQSHNYRERKRSSGKLSKGLGERLYKLQKGKCACCGEKLGSNYHMDHIIPLARGGENIDSNIQLLRPSCNIQKHARDPIEFMQKKGFLL